MHQIILVVLRHTATFLDYLGGVDIPLSSVPVPTNWAKLSKYIRDT